MNDTEMNDTEALALLSLIALYLHCYGKHCKKTSFKVIELIDDLATTMTFESSTDKAAEILNGMERSWAK